LTLDDVFQGDTDIKDQKKRVADQSLRWKFLNVINLKFSPKLAKRSRSRSPVSSAEVKARNRSRSRSRSASREKRLIPSSSNNTAVIVPIA
jgi:hypothetical protein